MKVISLFSGAMGLDLGFERAGFETAACVEIDAAAVATIKLNRPTLKVFDQSIAELTGGEILQGAGISTNDDPPLVIGGPPCQAFSVFGNRKGVEDRRGQLVFEFIRVINEIRPHAFVMENVRGLLSMPIVPKKNAIGKKVDRALTEPGSLINLIFEKFEQIGYRVDCYVVNAVNYGAPQIRERLIFIGNRHGLMAHFPGPMYSNRPTDNLPPFKTLGDAIGAGFSDPCPEVMNFSPRKLKYLSMIPEGGNWRSLPEEIQKESMGKSWYLKGGRSAYWRKLSFAFPSPTVVTMPNHAGTSMCHPKELRAITVGEAAAIQGFPTDWKFTGSATEKFRQVGNAVPCILGYFAGTVIANLMTRIKASEKPNETLPMHQVIHLRPHVRTRQFWKNGEALAGDHSYYDDDGDAIDEDQMELSFSPSS
ncbi:MAG: DNA cytosine methyltransferase [Alphaproteobacteria bacterium]|nr:DNA cytosine methyltransferase [Alphaproteobacteria bacterium]